MILITYSFANFKGFILSKVTLPSTVHYIMNMEYKKEVAIILDLANIYIISIDHYGNTYIVDFINEDEAGGLVCWA